MKITTFNLQNAQIVGGIILGNDNNKVWVMTLHKRDYSGYEYSSVLAVFSSPDLAFKANSGDWQKINDNFYRLNIEVNRKHLELYGYVLNEC